jgi:DNA-binding NarL/FixJ family response regulator
MSEAIVRVMLVDDHVIVREGLRAVLAATPGLRVVAEAGSAEEALERIGKVELDIVVLDLTLPGASGLEATTRLLALQPGLRILILSVHDHAEYVLGAVRAGAHGYLRKDTSPAELRDAVRAVARGESYFSQPVARQLSDALRGEAGGAADPVSRLARLTPREREVLLGVTAGETSRAIAERLGLSPRTVETYRENLMRKLEIRTVPGLTRFALDAGLLRSSTEREGP